MAKIVGGRWNGTGADVYICCGFVPDYVYCVNLSDPCEEILWIKYMTIAAAVEGLAWHDVTTVGDQAATEGIRPYEGGDTLTSDMAGTTTYGEGVYLKHDPRDYHWGTGSNAGPGNREGDAVSETINSWTLNTAANRTGQFNEDVTGTYIGAGSEIQIDQLWYVITAVTALAGEAADEVTLNYPAPSGVVNRIKGKYGYIPMVAGDITPAGFKVEENTHLNANDQVCVFMAMKFDN
jgi:hypothetical protein